MQAARPLEGEETMGSRGKHTRAGGASSPYSRKARFQRTHGEAVNAPIGTRPPIVVIRHAPFSRHGLSGLPTRAERRAFQKKLKANGLA
jgi:hypothetical protein